MNALGIAAITVSGVFLGAIMDVLLWYKISTWRDRQLLPNRHMWIESDIDMESAWSESPSVKGDNDDWRKEFEARITETNDEEFRELEKRQAMELSRQEPSVVETCEEAREPKTPWG